MAMKTIMKSGDDNQGNKIMGIWSDFTRFLCDVRAEVRKVVTPSRKEVQATTSVVVVTVFVFSLFFFVVDALCRIGVDRLLMTLGGL
jgi:preprotein translocase subunit SecE